MLKELMKLEKAKDTLKLNFLLIPVNVFDTTEEGAKNFNKFYLYIKSLGLNPIIRTASGGIALTTRIPAWDVRVNRVCVEITLIYKGFAWRLQFRSQLDKRPSGRAAFTRFKRLLKKRGINLDELAIYNGKEVKETIEKPLISIRKFFIDQVYEGVNHIDFHSSYAAGLANTHPEFRAVLEEIYHKREENAIYKDILNFSIGYFQSYSCCWARWAHFSRDAIADNNKRVKELAQKLDSLGYLVILYNTDGFWYKGPVYHGEGEGEGLGAWHNDHTNCRFRAKSSGSYEYIENGIYHAVVRGVPNSVKDKWEWGSIYSKEAAPKTFEFVESEGVLINGKVV